MQNNIGMKTVSHNLLFFCLYVKNDLWKSAENRSIFGEIPFIAL